jgi:hypothetical protein
MKKVVCDTLLTFRDISNDLCDIKKGFMCHEKGFMCHK